MILGVGIDLCEVRRMEEALEKGGLLERFFAEEEQAYIRARGRCAAESMAGHFAAKEAALKAMGVGLVLPLFEVVILHDARGAPMYQLRGKAEAKMRALGGERMHLSITHTGDIAAAVAVMEGKGAC